MPPFQPYYTVDELPKDDMLLTKPRSIQAIPTVVEFSELKDKVHKQVQKESGQAAINETNNSAKLRYRYNVSKFKTFKVRLVFGPYLIDL